MTRPWRHGIQNGQCEQDQPPITTTPTGPVWAHARHETNLRAPARIRQDQSQSHCCKLEPKMSNCRLQVLKQEFGPRQQKKIRMFPLCVVSNLLYGVPGFKQGAFVFFFLFHPSYLTSLNQSYFGWNSATEKPHVGFRSNYIQWLWKLLRVPICYVMYFWHLKAGNFS